MFNYLKNMSDDQRSGHPWSCRKRATFQPTIKAFADAVEKVALVFHSMGQGPARHQGCSRLHVQAMQGFP